MKRMTSWLSSFRVLLPVAAVLLTTSLFAHTAHAGAPAVPVAAFEQTTQPTSVPTVAADSAKTDKPAPGNADAGHKVPKAAVITLGERGDKDMVGKYLTEHQLKEILPMLRQDLGDDGSGVVVFRITSGGGALLEIQKLSDVIHNDYKKHFRVVAWIDSAISAAAMTAHCIEEIYFTPQGNYGACTGWFGALQAVKGRDLEEVLFMMTKISARGGYDPLVMRSMQIMDPLSATVDENGQVKYYPDATSGKIVLNPEGKILTLNAETAAKIHFSRGTAESLEELTRLMGYQELNWIGDQKKGFIWPVSRAEKWSMEYRERVFKAENLFQADAANYQQQIAAAEGAQDRKERGVFVNRALTTLRKLRRSVQDNPNFALFQFNMMPDQFEEWYKEQERQLKNMMR
jgi:hypothetical protein